MTGEDDLVKILKKAPYETVEKLYLEFIRNRNEHTTGMWVSIVKMLNKHGWTAQEFIMRRNNE